MNWTTKDRPARSRHSRLPRQLHIRIIRLECCSRHCHNHEYSAVQAQGDQEEQESMKDSHQEILYILLQAEFMHAFMK